MDHDNNKLIQFVQLEVYFEFFLLWPLCTNVTKGTDLSTGLFIPYGLYDIVNINKIKKNEKFTP